MNNLGRQFCNESWMLHTFITFQNLFPTCRETSILGTLESRMFAFEFFKLPRVTNVSAHIKGKYVFLSFHYPVLCLLRSKFISVCFLNGRKNWQLTVFQLEKLATYSISMPNLIYYCGFWSLFVSCMPAGVFDYTENRRIWFSASLIFTLGTS